MTKPEKSFKFLVQTHGDYVLDYSEHMKAQGKPCWFIGAGRVAGNTTPIPSGFHETPRKAWYAAAIALGLAQEGGAR